MDICFSGRHAVRHANRKILLPYWSKWTNFIHTINRIYTLQFHILYNTHTTVLLLFCTKAAKDSHMRKKAQMSSSCQQTKSKSDTYLTHKNVEISLSKAGLVNVDQHRVSSDNALDILDLKQYSARAVQLLYCNFAPYAAEDYPVDPRTSHFVLYKAKSWAVIITNVPSNFFSVCADKYSVWAAHFHAW